MKHLLSTAILLLALAACGGSSPGRTSGATADPDTTPDTPAASSRTLIIVDDTAAPEGSTAEPGTIRFPVMLSEPSATDVVVNFITADGTAIAGTDYQSSNGSLTIPAGETLGHIEIELLGDEVDEDAKSLALFLSGASGADLPESNITGTIANDDGSCTASSSVNPWFDRRILNFSHRGGEQDYPENTLYAYKQSRTIGAEVQEMDIYESADGELVVIHDSTVDRTTNDVGMVSSFTLAELKTMDAAYWFVPGKGTTRDAAEEEYVFRGIATGDRPPPAGFTANDFTIPTLEETLAKFPNDLINIELKPDPDSTGSYEAKLAELLLDFGRRDDVIVASFIDAPSSLFKAAAPCISTSYPTGQAATVVLSSQGPAPQAPRTVHDAWQVPPSLGIEVVTQDFVDDAHAAGVAVHVWTINTCDEMERLLYLGVDAIMTDEPNLLEALLAQPEGQWSCSQL